MIKIFNEDCLITMKEHIESNSIDIVLTSPPYNNSRTSHTEYSMKTANCRYLEYDDNKTNEEYCKWTCDIFNLYDKILKKDGVVLYNISYGSENPTVMFECIADICKNTNFMIADTIVWKKKSAFPNNVSPNKLTRICEFVFVFCRKDEFFTYKANKKVRSYSRFDQPFYEPIYNMVVADNNDGANELNKATFSTELVEKLLEMYAVDKDITVYDSFMGTGTTAVACKYLGYNCFGSELSKDQWEYANNRIDKLDNKIKDKTETTIETLW